MSMDKKRWIILVLQIIIGLVTMFVYLLANLVGPLHAVKGWSIGSMMFVFTAMMWVSPLAMMIGGKMRDKIGNRLLIIIVGIFYGVSICVSVLFSHVFGFILFGGLFAAFAMFAIYVAQLSNIGMLFPDKRGFAMGLYNAGTGLGLAAITMPVVFLIDRMSIVPAIIILGVVMGGLTVLCGIFAIDPPEGYKPAGWDPSKNENLQRISEGKNYTWLEMIKTPTFFFLLFSLIGLQIGGMAVSANVAEMAKNALGVTDIGGGVYATLSSAAGGFGGLVVGTIADKLGTPKTMGVFAIFSLLSALLYVTIGEGKPFFFGLVVVAMMVGYVGQAVVMSVGTMNIFGEKNFGFNMGVVGISGLLASLIGPQVAGNAGVSQTILVGGIAAACSIVLAILLGRSMKSLVAKEKAKAAAAEPAVEPSEEA